MWFETRRGASFDETREPLTRTLISNILSIERETHLATDAVLWIGKSDAESPARATSRKTPHNLAGPRKNERAISC